MKTNSETFGLRLDNIPHINLRNEFAHYQALLQEKDFISKFRGAVEPIETPYMVWYGMPDDLLSIILQRVILGVESYLPGAVFMELGYRGKLDRETLEYLRNPFALRGWGVVENYYHKLPALIDERYSLQNCDPDLFSKTKAFYKEVRNPLFHGQQVSDNDIIGVKRVFMHLMSIYAWIDRWHDPDPNAHFNRK